MKKSTFWIIMAAISIILAAHAALTLQFIKAIIGITTCCASLVVGSWYEREEREQEEKH